MWGNYPTHGWPIDFSTIWLNNAAYLNNFYHTLCAIIYYKRHALRGSFLNIAGMELEIQGGLREPRDKYLYFE